MGYNETKTARRYRELLRKWIREAGLDQTTLAEKLSVSQASISKYLNGKQEISVDVFSTLATVSGVNAIRILEEATDKAPAEKPAPVYSPGMQKFMDDPLTKASIAKGLIQPELISALELLDQANALGDSEDTRAKFGMLLVWASSPPSRTRR